MRKIMNTKGAVRRMNYGSCLLLLLYSFPAHPLMRHYRNVSCMFVSGMTITWSFPTLLRLK